MYTFVECVWSTNGKFKRNLWASVGQAYSMIVDMFFAVFSLIFIIIILLRDLKIIILSKKNYSI